MHLSCEERRECHSVDHKGGRYQKRLLFTCKVKRWLCVYLKLYLDQSTLPEPFYNILWCGDVLQVLTSVSERKCQYICLHQHWSCLITSRLEHMVRSTCEDRRKTIEKQEAEWINGEAIVWFHLKNQ